jgi:hypothetical protein
MSSFDSKKGLWVCRLAGLNKAPPLGKAEKKGAGGEPRLQPWCVLFSFYAHPPPFMPAALASDLLSRGHAIRQDDNVPRQRSCLNIPLSLFSSSLSLLAHICLRSSRLPTKYFQRFVLWVLHGREDVKEHLSPR